MVNENVTNVQYHYQKEMQVKTTMSYLGCDVVLEFNKMLHLGENGKRVHRMFLSDLLQLHLNPKYLGGGAYFKNRSNYTALLQTPKIFPSCLE